MPIEARTTSVAGRSTVRTRLVAIGIALVAAVAIWGIATAAGAPLEVDQGQGVMSISLISVVFAVVFVGLLAWGLLALLERSARGVTIWTVIAGIVTALSFFPVIASEATTGTRVTLAAMHLAVAAVIIPLFRRSSGAA
ncbi:hypothetical protein ACTI_45970 [Actinoplanes sp. OR16]|uniref:DUF6069 family protein n=1 Tax=Actinoplanes sp. OR16 TaxID=946334 RepID=UPI000F6CB0E8|nr:DUF6069 family protein [Actinoplanes sp. OR16]BBH67912.1 hypothetical protein ACTI_45970 [Actinoplanes sp. OR16]